MNMRDNEQVGTGVAEKAGKHGNSSANGKQFRPTKCPTEGGHPESFAVEIETGG